MADVFAGPVVEKVVDSFYDAAKKKIGYMWNCKENVEKFKKEVESLKNMKRQVQEQIRIANLKGDNLLPGVEEWLNKADTEISKAEVFLGEFHNAKKTCFKIGMCGNWATLYHYGKGATEMTPPLLEHKANGTHFVTCVSVETLPPTQLDVYQTKNPEDLVTHNSALNAIIAALEDESKQIIGIYGLGGVGKTTLAMEVAERVKKTNLLFAGVYFTTVSRTVNAEKIQKDLGRGTKRIMKGDKILLILDDVWDNLNLEELCIPCGSNYKNCKILLTSRNEKVCLKMNAQRIHVDPLRPEEAWILFKRFVGERVETEVDLKPVAEEVAKQCGGLPLLIQAVGNALKDVSIRLWESALTRLKKNAPSDIDEGIWKAFTHLKLSYDYLESKDARSCFLLCSLFPEDKGIELENLVLYGVGLGKFDNPDNIQDARDRVQMAVNILTSSGLLDVKYKIFGEDFYKMHDVVRDVALLIGENKFSVDADRDLTKWLPTNNTTLESSTAISLMFKIPGYEVHQPRLDIFCINKNSELPMSYDEFIRGIEVKVLDMACNGVSSVPQSFQLLTKLRMLDLAGNKSFHEISILGKMKDLEILILNYTGITGIPQEIGQLVKLRRLEVIGCRDLYHITPGVISRLQRLEELCIDFSSWMSEGVSDCIVEVMKLSKLTYLDLKVNSFDHIPECFNSENLKGFVIQIGDSDRIFIWHSSSDRHLIISRVHLVIPLLKWLKKLIEVSRPEICLCKIENLNNIMPALYDEGFNKLDSIRLRECPNVPCLVDDGTRCDGDEGKTEEKFFKELKYLQLLDLDNLERLWKCPDEYICLTNLVTLFIFRCSKLVRVFTVSVAQGLVNLKDLSIQSCDCLEEVIWGGDGGEEIDRGSEEIVEQQQHSSSTNAIIIVFSSLAKIRLGHLKSLKSFFNSTAGNGNCSIIIKYPSLVDVTIYDCESMKIWGPGIHETPNLKTTLYDVLPVEKLWTKRWKQEVHLSDYVSSYSNDDDDDDEEYNNDDDDESNGDDD